MKNGETFKDLQDAARFDIGRLLFTPGAIQEIPPETAGRALLRHISGDWGDVCLVDRQANESALRTGRRLFSVCHTEGGMKFWIITEADRSYTTVLLPSEY